MFIAKDIEIFCDFAEHVSKSGVNDHIFCAAVRFASWLLRYCACLEVVEEFDGETKLFEVAQMELIYCYEHSNYLHNSGSKRLRHTNVVNQTICCYRKGLPFTSMLAAVCYDAPGDLK